MKKKLAVLLSLLVLSSCSVTIPSFNVSLSSNISESSQNTTSSELESSSSSGSSSSLSSTTSSSSSSKVSSSSSSSKPSSSSSSSSKPSSSSSSSKPSSSSSKPSSSSSKPSSSSSSSSNTGNTGNSKLYNATYTNNTPDGYYESCRGKKGEELKRALHNIIDDHEEFSYGNSIDGYMKSIDEDINDTSKMHFIYTGITSKDTSFNKEHVWAKSHGGFDTKKPAGSDLHNLRPCNSNLNSTRGNLDFDMGGTLLSQYNGNNRRGSTFEPSDFSKGDVARTIFYMAVRYEGDGEPQLEVESPSDTTRFYDYSSGASGVHGNFDALYDWATSGIDPVDDQEVKRNNIIYSDYQHNRNPFIDHPEFIIMIYDKTYNGAGALNDLDPFKENIDPQEEKQRFEELVSAIGTVNENSSQKIEDAKNYYNNMSQDAKDISLEIYDDLLALIEAYEEYMDVYGVEITIDLIDAIGEVTLESKNAIEKAEAAYNDLTEEQKSRVTNYQTLLDAREEFDIIYEQWLLEQKEKGFEISFNSIQGAPSGYTSNVTLTSGDKQLVASYCGVYNNEFRLGHNDSAKGETNIVTASGTSYSNSTSLKTLFMFKGTKITLTSTGKYGTVNKLYILNSLDGNTWKNIASFDGNFSGSRTYEADITSYESSYYAILIAGSTPRLVLNTLKFS